MADGSDFKGERLTVQFARGPRRKENVPPPMDRPSMPRPRRTIYRMLITGLPETSWQVSCLSCCEFAIHSVSSRGASILGTLIQLDELPSC